MNEKNIQSNPIQFFIHFYQISFFKLFWLFHQASVTLSSLLLISFVVNTLHLCKTLLSLTRFEKHLAWKVWFYKLCLKIIIIIILKTLPEKCLHTEFFLVHIFLYSDRIRRFNGDLLRKSLGKYGPEKNIFGHFWGSEREYEPLYYFKLYEPNIKKVSWY